MPLTTPHLCTRCHGGGQSTRCRLPHGASNIGLEETPRQGWRNSNDSSGSTTVALCPRSRATTAYTYVGGTTVVLCQRAGATLAHGCLRGTTMALCLGGRATMAHPFVGGTTVVLCH